MSTEASVVAESIAPTNIEITGIGAAHRQRALNTPRTREACKRLGFSIEELQIRSFESFYIPGGAVELQSTRFERYENMRRRRLEDVLQERSTAIAESAGRSNARGSRSSQFISMLENLFEKEAGRLQDEHGQMPRQYGHSANVDGKQGDEEVIPFAARVEPGERNGDQTELRLNRAVASTRRCSESRIQAEMPMESASVEAFESTCDTEGANGKGSKSPCDKAQSARAANHDREQEEQRAERARFAEEERMRIFRTEQAKAAGAKAMAKRENADRAREKSMELQLRRSSEGEAMVREIEAKMSRVSANRARQQQLRRIESERHHLDIMDARSRKAELDRVDSYRRDELREQIDNGAVRIETFMSLKGQLLEQRRARARMAMKGARTMTWGRDGTPGPGQYEAPPSCLFEKSAPKVGRARAPGLIDSAVRVTAANPAPGAYDATRLKNGDLVEQASNGSVKWGGGDRTSFLDHVVKAKGAVPAPGSYKMQSTLDRKAPKIQRDEVVSGPKDRLASSKSSPWIWPSTDTPGPATYSVDDFTRKMQRHAQRPLSASTRHFVKDVAK